MTERNNPLPVPAGLEHFGDRYKEITPVGQGGHATVYRALDSVLLKWIAIKVLSAKTLSESQLVSFQNEAKLVSKLKHPNLVTVLDFGIGPKGRPYLIMDFIKGNSLKSALKTGKISRLTEIIEVFIEICEGMQHAHEQGVLHQDLKPGNIMFHEKDAAGTRIKIVDFGVAQDIMDDCAITISETKTVGSPPYMAPEIIESKQPMRQSDVYSVGCMLYEALTGRQPFRGATALETCRLHLTGPVPSLETGAQFEISEHLSEIVSRCMQKDPMDRFESMRQLQKELIKELRGEGAPLVPKKSDSANALRKSFPFFVLLIFAGIASAVLLCANTTRAIFEQSVTRKSEDSSTKSASAAVASEQECKLIRKRDPDNGSPLWRPNDLYYVQLTDEDLKSIAHQLPANLYVKGMTITGTGLSYLSHWPMTKLDMSLTNLNSEGMKNIAKFKDLEALEINHTKITNEDFKQLCYLHKLRTINFLACEDINNEGLEKVLMSNPKLESLKFGYQKITPEIIPALKKMKNLRRLEAQNCGLSDSDIKELTKLPLQRLYLYGNEKLTNETLKYLDHHPTIRDISVSNCHQISDAALKQFIAQNDEIKVKVSGENEHVDEVNDVGEFFFSD